MLLPGRVILLAELSVYNPLIFSFIFSMKHFISYLIMQYFRIITFAVQVSTRNPLLSKTNLMLQLNTSEIDLSCMITGDKSGLPCKVKAMNKHLELP